MKRRLQAGAAIVALGLLWAPTGTLAEQASAQPKTIKEQLVGAWRVMLIDRIAADGSRTPLYGPNPAGQLVFDASGHYAGLIGRNAIAKFAANDPKAGTPDENKAVVQGTFADTGRYTVNETDKTIDLQIELSTFPNWTGTRQKRSVMIAGDDLVYTADAGTDNKVELYLRRAK